MTIATKLEMIPSLVAQFVEEVLSGDVWKRGEVKIWNLDEFGLLKWRARFSLHSDSPRYP